MAALVRRTCKYSLLLRSLVVERQPLLTTLQAASAHTRNSGPLTLASTCTTAGPESPVTWTISEAVKVDSEAELVGLKAQAAGFTVVDPLTGVDEGAPSTLDVANALASNSAISSRRVAIIDTNEAARRLGQAQLQREQGAESLPGEQVQGIDVSVVNHRYWRRQEKLRRVIEQAQRRSSETRGRTARAAEESGLNRLA